MNNKGFTLIELIAAIAIMAIIGMVLAINISGILKRQNLTACQKLIERVKSAADVYIHDYDEQTKEEIYQYEEDEDPPAPSVDIEDLVAEGLLNEDELINPYTNEDLSGYIVASAPDHILKLEYVSGPNESTPVCSENE